VIISAALRAVAVELRREVDLITLEGGDASTHVFGAAIEAMARSLVAQLALDSEAAWRLSFDALADEFLHELDA
jgi:hypothetical protein